MNSYQVHAWYYPNFYTFLHLKRRKGVKGDDYDEDKYGIDNVRSGSYTSIKLVIVLINYLRKYGHSKINCYQF